MSYPPHGTSSLKADDRYRAVKEMRERLRRHHFDYFITLTANDPTASYDKMKRALKNWDARVNRLIVGSNWQERPDERLLWFAFLEKADSNPHWHLLAEMDPDLIVRRQAFFDSIDISLEMDRIWSHLVPGGTCDVQPFRDEGAIQYVTKDYHRAMDRDHFASHLDYIRV
ncbi:hypothetical protein [Puniceibacterium sediminis]|uniref:Uncharacterized protein n=1 Tax=Puniceibacterium sediminis TaxID=1608407 RepID=A0A238Z5J5_9RHOB|nr:hypothetical protein [Puniceibacterium sediminis]SNR78269.1 hypothetical protein SAMN06265370_12420 [Puniceibacterium sediminis]